MEIDCWLKGRFQSTLPRGERRPTVLDPVMGMHFNPRSHEGSDRKYGKPVKVSIEFQSTLPRGERPYTGGYGGSVTDFNPRSHEGSDIIPAVNRVIGRISIHAPTRGATVTDHVLLCSCKISIHAPTRGATLVKSTSVRPMLISIHAPTRGATKPMLPPEGSPLFQSTLPQGERRRCGVIPQWL